jgi:DNA-binding CsgD family transcriptional regulator
VPPTANLWKYWPCTTSGDRDLGYRAGKGCFSLGRVLVGRARECRRVTEALDRVRGGGGALLLVTGSPGLGKSALLDYAAAAAGELTVLRACGAEFEAPFAWAGLHQLLRPVLGQLDGLPADQAAALRGALRLGPATGHDPFLVSLALLTLLSQAAAGSGLPSSGLPSSGLLCLVDDAQWLDDQSADALRFVARRLDRDQIGLVVAARDAPASRFTLDRWPRIDLSGLGADGLAELLSQQTAGVSPQVRERLLDHAGGNPLALLEIAAALTADELAGRRPLPDPLPLSPGLEKAFLDQVRRLSPGAQQLLLVAACAQGDSWDDVHRAARELGLPDRLDELERARLIVIGADGAGFRHPLVRSAVISATPFSQRRDAHLALARMLAGVDDTDRRTWHRAAACLGTDSEIAGELDAAARRASRHSGFAAAAAAFERAAELSPDAAAAARRLLDAGQAAFQAGQPERALADAQRAEHLAAGERPTAGGTAVPGRAAWLRGQIQLRAGQLGEAIGTLGDGAEVLADQDPQAAIEMLLDASEAAEYAGDAPAMTAIAAQAGRVAASATTPGAGLPAGIAAGAGLLAGIADMLSGQAERGSAAISAALDQMAGTSSAQWLRWAGTGSLYLGDNRRTSRLFRESARRARATGALDFLPLALSGVGTAEQVRGRFADAEVAADEGLRLARETGQRIAEGLNLTTLAAVAAFHGEDDRCRQYARAALDLAIPRRFSLVAASATWALALLELGLGQAAAALPRLQALTEADSGAGHFLIGLYALPDLVDAAARCDDAETAQRTLVRLEQATASSPGPWLEASLARCRGLLAGPAEAVKHQQEAVRLYDQGDGGFELARAHLELGEALRRARHRTEARDTLRPALTALEALGARPWAERARAELRALGDTPATATPGGLSALTPQELQIARLVSGGASNREIAAQLFLSARTVEYHLYKIFPKAGVSSRTELARLVLTQDAR